MGIMAVRMQGPGSALGPQRRLHDYMMESRSSRATWQGMHEAWERAWANGKEQGNWYNSSVSRVYKAESRET